MLFQSRKSFFAIAVSFLVSPTFVYAKAKVPIDKDQEILNLPNPDCFRFLDSPTKSFYQRVELIEAYNQFRLGRQQNYGGFYFETKRPSRKARVIEKNLSDRTEPFWRTEKWSLPGEELRFWNVGFKNLQGESAIINNVLAYHALNAPNDSLKLNFSARRAARERVLVNLRWHIHDAVLETYAEKKRYLSPADLFQLVSYNSESSNNDVFALMSPTARAIELMTYEELRRELLMTIQISYFGTRNYLTPSLRGVLEAAGYRFYEGNDRLPFEYRIDDAGEFRERFYQRFKKETTCEMNRYVKFGKMGVGMQDRFLLKAIMTASKAGMKTIVATADRLTTRLFKGYGFKIYEALPGESNDELEFLLYLETDSAEFRDFQNRLALSSENVKIEVIQ